MNPSSIDYTQTHLIENHRYRFWFRFPNGDTLKNEFSVPGFTPAADADVLAQAAWAESMRLSVGTRPPNEVAFKRFTSSMARAAGQGAHWSVARPYQTEYVG